MVLTPGTSVIARCNNPFPVLYVAPFRDMPFIKSLMPFAFTAPCMIALKAKSLDFTVVEPPLGLVIVAVGVTQFNKFTYTVAVSLPQLLFAVK